MEYQQVKAANPNITWINEACEEDVRNTFAIPTHFPTAIADWNASSATNHPNETPPSNIQVPIYFSYEGPDGHVALWDRGVIYSSSSHGKQTFTSIQALINWMGERFKYLGWGEKMDNVTVVGQIATPAPAAPISGLPAIGSKIQLIPTQDRSTWKIGTATQVGTIHVTDNTFIYVIRGYDSAYPGRAIINSASAGGNGVGLALHYNSGAVVEGWKAV